MSRKLIIAALLLVGTVLIAYPSIDSSIQERRQNELLAGWQHSVASSREEEGMLATQGNVPDMSQSRPVPLAVSPDAGSEETEGAVQSSPLGAVGAIRIPSIDAYEPILPNSTAKSLKVGIGTVVEGRDAGEEGNLVLAGHRARKYGKQFNRLAELQEGDEIVVENGEGSYTYQVTTSFLVEPTDLSVLNEEEGVHGLTLITCHPMRNPTHRLIVRAVLVELEGAQAQVQAPAQAELEAS